MKERLTLAEIQTKLIGKTAGLVLGSYEEKAGSIIIDQSLESLGLTIDSAGVIRKMNDANGYRNVHLQLRKVLTESNTPATNADAQILTGTEYRYVIGIQCYLKAAVAVATRAFKLTVQNKVPVTLGTLQAIDTTTFDLTTGQEGQIVLGSGPDHFQNDNGTISKIADENPLPIVLNPLSVIKATATNKNADDRLGLYVRYQEVG